MKDLSFLSSERINREIKQVPEAEIKSQDEKRLKLAENKTGIRSRKRWIYEEVLRPELTLGFFSFE